MDGSNRLGRGEARFCDECDEPYREVRRLPNTVGMCPTCFEEAMNGNQNT